MRHIWFFLLSMSSLFLVVAQAEPIPPHVGEWNFTDYVSYYRTAGNYSSNYLDPVSYVQSGNLWNNGYLSTLTDTVSVNYDALKNWRFNANLTYDYTSVAETTLLGINQTLTASGVSEAGLGAQYWVRTKRWALVPQITGGVPFYRNSLSQTGALLGNGTSWVEGGSYGILYFFPVAVYGYAGYRYQDSGQSGLVNLELGGSYRFNTARLRIGVRGEAAVGNDSDADSNNIFNENNRNLLLRDVSDGSFRFYSMNPTLFDAYVEGDWLFTRMWEAGLGFSQSVYGVNAAVGWTVTAMIRFRLPGDDSRASANSQQNYMQPSISEPLFEPAGTGLEN